MENQHTAQLSDISVVIGKYRKLIIIATLLVTAAAAVILFLKPKYYSSAALIVPANPILGDRSNIFRTQFENEFPYFGSEADADRLMGLAMSENLHRFLIDSFHLSDHYKLDRDAKKELHTKEAFEENILIGKNEWGHIKIKVWDKDKNMAADIANAFVFKVNQSAQQMFNEAKSKILIQLKKDRESNRTALDSIIRNQGEESQEMLQEQSRALLNQLQEKDDLIQQFTTSLNDVNSLYVIDKALPALRPDKPRIAIGIAVAFFASAFFSILTALIIERSRQK